MASELLNQLIQAVDEKDSPEPQSGHVYEEYISTFNSLLTVLLGEGYTAVDAYGNPLTRAIKWAIYEMKMRMDNDLYRDENTVSYGQDEGSIWTDEGKERLWKEHRLFYPENGVFAFKVREKRPDDRISIGLLLELFMEDDGYLFPAGERSCPVVFSERWLGNLLEVARRAREKIEDEK